MDRRPAALKKVEDTMSCPAGPRHLPARQNFDRFNPTEERRSNQYQEASPQEVVIGPNCEREEQGMNTPNIHTRWFMALIVALALGVFPMGASALLEDQGAWIDTITGVTASIIPEDSLQPYLGQLQIVRTALRYGDERSVSTAMSRFMEMLDRREYGVSAEAATRLLDSCVRIIPAKFHDVSRHPGYRDLLDRMNEENGFGSSGG